ncbi:MAG TPA: radical SAM family heme chaperone HemW [Ignavibacteriales bacterium]|nr:radical SAM family heme chaperone HemW [Ignavibacteriales bacterium]
MQLKEAALYIHIPFCEHKCIYCDFYSVITKDNVEAYLNALKKEVDHYAPLYSDGRIFTSIFFGGGTPSLMEPEYIEEILGSLRRHFRISDDAEITLETNPGTVSNEKLYEFLASGINRLSIGIQSFNDDELKFLTRIHDRQTAINTILDADKMGFKNINLDLIFNLPGQTKRKWLDNLETAVQLPVKHISAYSLILERGTVLNKLVLDGKVKLQDADYDAGIYRITMDFLRSHRFHQYEVSNFAKQGFECRHNNAYWHYRDYLSFGTSAHSFVNGRRWWNYSNISLYIKKISETESAVAGFEELTESQMLTEYIMLAFRSSGLNLAAFREKFGDEWLESRQSQLKSFQRRGLLLFEDGHIHLTEKGYALCDEILEKIL